MRSATPAYYYEPTRRSSFVQVQDQPRWRFPWVTFLLMAAFIVIFLIEQHVSNVGSNSGAPSLGALVAMGGSRPALFNLGEGFRWLTAPFLHANLGHLLGNAVAFMFAGYLLERQAGHAWTFCIFSAGALAGSAMSMALLPQATVTVGASGAIMAMLAALFFITFRQPDSVAKTRNQRRVLFLLIPALIPHGGGSMHVDYGAHFGGTLLGCVLGLLLLLTWQEDEPLPALRRGAMALALAALIAIGTAGYAVARLFPAYEPLAHLMPNERIPHGSAAIAANAFRLLAAYPNDPRSHMVAAQAEMQRRDLAGAEEELKTALSLTDTRAKIIFPALKTSIEGLLAITLVMEGRRPEAAVMAADACLAVDEATPGPAVMAELEREHLCQRRSVAEDNK